VGAANEQVLVESQAAGVETVNPTLGESVTSRPIVNMPLNGRNVLDLALCNRVLPRTIRTIRARVMARPELQRRRWTFGFDNLLTRRRREQRSSEQQRGFQPESGFVAEFRILTSNYTRSMAAAALASSAS